MYICNSESALELDVLRKIKVSNYKKAQDFFVFILSFYLINQSEGQINYFPKFFFQFKITIRKTRDIFFDVKSHNLINQK